MRGKLILVVGLPGSGKGTLIAHAKEAFPELVFPISWTTRAMRPGEREGEVYHFAAKEEFMRSVAAGEFLEWVTIDTGHCYGTRRADIEGPLSEGKFVLREVEVIGARNIRSLLPKEELATIFINTDSWEDLKARMLARAPMSEEELQARHARYESEVSFLSEADYVVENRHGHLEEAKRDFDAAIRAITGAN